MTITLDDDTWDDMGHGPFPKRPSSVDSFLDALSSADPSKFENREPAPDPFSRELVVDPNGLVRQAGADVAATELISGLKSEAEASLYFFTRAILGRQYLDRRLHGTIFCPFIQRCPPRRKLALIPRFHCKSTVVSQSLPLHILIQHPDRNLYFPGEWGSEQRILLIGEADRTVGRHASTMRAALESNALVRAFWPHICWDRPQREAPHWSSDAFTVRRQNPWPEPSVSIAGITTRITGIHPSVLIKDDLIAEAAANSPAMMEAAIDFHRATRAFIGRPQDLEFIIGTRWAPSDLYSEIIDNDPTVECMVLSAFETDEHGKQRPIYPAAASVIEDCRRTMGPRLFSLLFLNSEEDESINDFAGLPRRFYQRDGSRLFLSESPLDEPLYTLYDAPRAASLERGTPLRDAYKVLRKRAEWRGA